MCEGMPGSVLRIAPERRRLIVRRFRRALRRGECVDGCVAEAAEHRIEAASGFGADDLAICLSHIDSPQQPVGKDRARLHARSPSRPSHSLVRPAAASQEETAACREPALLSCRA
jgi:hypothetical protein